MTVGSSARNVLGVACALCALFAFVQNEVFAEDAEAATDATEVEAASTDTQAQTENVAPEYALDSVLESLRTDLAQSRAGLKAREAEFAKRKQASEKRLANAEAKMAQLEKQGTELEAAFESNRVELDDKAKLLKDKLGALKELFGVFQQNASDLIAAFNGSTTSIQYPDRDQWLESFANRMKNASEVSSVEDIMGLWFEMQREITALGEIVRLRAPVVNADNTETERDFVRIGGFSLITHDPEPAYLQWSDVGQEVVLSQRQPVGEYAAQIDEYLSSGEGLHAVSVDPTGGALTSLLALKPTPTERIHQGGLVGYIILVLGALALVLATYKLVDITLITVRVRSQQRNAASPRQDNVLGQLLLVYQNNRHMDSETLGMRLHDAVQKGALRVNRFTIFLAIIAAVAPLLGLLGTVVGMINTFQAITLYGTGDPQTMAGGISQALITTVLGLVVAVPAVLLHAVVSGRARGVINVLQQQMAALTGDRIEQEHGPAGRPQNGGDFGRRPQPAPA